MCLHLHQNNSYEYREICRQKTRDWKDQEEEKDSRVEHAQTTIKVVVDTKYHFLLESSLLCNRFISDIKTSSALEVGKYHG
jgi:hypothetical protein